MIECLVEVKYVYNMTRNIFRQILSPIFTLIPQLILSAYMRQREMSDETRNEWQSIATYMHTNSRANLCRPVVGVFYRTILWPYMLRIITPECTLYHTLIYVALIYTLICLTILLPYMLPCYCTQLHTNLCLVYVALICRTILWPYMLRNITHDCALYHTLICGALLYTCTFLLYTCTYFNSSH